MRTVGHYPTDVSDAQWEVRQLLLLKPPGPQPRNLSVPRSHPDGLACDLPSVSSAGQSLAREQWDIELPRCPDRTSLSESCSTLSGDFDPDFDHITWLTRIHDAAQMW